MLRHLPTRFDKNGFNIELSGKAKANHGSPASELFCLFLKEKSMDANSVFLSQKRNKEETWRADELGESIKVRRCISLWPCLDSRHPTTYLKMVFCSYGKGHFSYHKMKHFYATG